MIPWDALDIETLRLVAALRRELRSAEEKDAKKKKNK